MPDRILVKDLLLRTIIGVNDDERTNRQDVLINLTLETDTRSAGRSDDLAQSVNYRTVTKEVIELVENSRFLLVERLAEEIARLCLEHERVSRVQVTVEKPNALRFASSVGLSIERGREDR
jgi:D-erythro-7,8-dihydroneopterin triphosphate epimerase